MRVFLLLQLHRLQTLAFFTGSDDNIPYDEGYANFCWLDSVLRAERVCVG